MKGQRKEEGEQRRQRERRVDENQVKIPVSCVSALEFTSSGGFGVC